MQAGTDLVLRSTPLVRFRCEVGWARTRNQRTQRTGLELALMKSTGNDAGAEHRIKSRSKSTNPQTDNGVPSSSKTGGRRLHLKRKIVIAQAKDAA